MRAILRCVARSNRPPLFALEAGRKRPPQAPRVSPWAVVAVTVAAVLVGLVVYTVWVLRPLTDRAAGAIPADEVPTLPAPGHHQKTATAPAGLPALSAARASTHGIPGVSLDAGLIVDPQSGRVLWLSHPHQHRAIASLTKMTTALVANQAHRTSGSFVVTPAMTQVSGDTLGIQAGSRVKARDMLAAALIPSDNDAAQALAIHTAGTVPAFVARMNAYARHLGLHDTRYSNPSGIVDAGNHSSAWDVAVLARAVLATPSLATLVGSKVYSIHGRDDLVNTNQLLWNYTGARGVKTGFTDASGRCLAAAATVGRHTLIAVVLGSHGDEFQTATHMLDWGFHRLHRG